MYGSCGSIEQASQIFNDTQDRDDFSWNVMIKAYARNGHLLQAKQVFDRMPEEWRGVFTYNTLIIGYLHRGMLKEAVCLFEQMPVRTILSWNVMIAACTQRGHPRDALRLWKRVNLRPDSFTYTSALKACGELQESEEGRRIHARVQEARLLPSDVILATALVDMYGKCGMVKEAESVFQTVCSNTEDIVLWTAMQTAYALNGHLLQTKQLFEQMQHKDVISWTNMVVAYSTSGCIEQAKTFFDSMPVRNSVTWTAMITGYTQNGYCKQALSLFLCMDLEGFSPNIITFIGTLDACSALADIAQGRRIHREILELGLRCNVKLETAIVNMYGKCGALHEGRLYFDKMKERNIWSWNAMITAYAQRAHHKPALELFGWLNLEGQDPDQVTFMGVLSACSHAGLLEAGYCYFTSMTTDYACPVNINHYVCMVDLLGRSGKLTRAEELINTMPFTPTSTAWTALLNACEMHRDGEKAGRVPGQALGRDQGPYVLLSNIQILRSNTFKS